MTNTNLTQSSNAKPPVQCGGCGREITFEQGQLVGDPEAVAHVREMRAALEAWDQWWLDRLADPDLPAPVPQTQRLLRRPLT